VVRALAVEGGVLPDEALTRVVGSVPERVIGRRKEDVYIGSGDDAQRAKVPFGVRSDAPVREPAFPAPKGGQLVRSLSAKGAASSGAAGPRPVGSPRVGGPGSQASASLLTRKYSSLSQKEKERKMQERLKASRLQKREGIVEAKTGPVMDPDSHAARKMREKEEAERKQERERQRKLDREAEARARVAREEERRKQKEADAERRKQERIREREEKEQKRLADIEKRRKQEALRRLSDDEDDEDKVFGDSSDDEEEARPRAVPIRRRRIANDDESDDAEQGLPKRMRSSALGEPRNPDPEPSSPTTSGIEVPAALTNTLGHETNCVSQEDLETINLFFDDRTSLFSRLSDNKIDVLLHQVSKPSQDPNYSQVVESLYFEMNSSGGWRKIRRKRKER